MLRTILSLFILFFLYTDTLFGQSIKYVLHGKISNWSPPATAYLTYTKAGRIQADSTPINNGRFTFRAVTSDVGDAPFLSVSKSGNKMASTGVKLIRFFADSTVISIVLTDSLTDAVVIGGSLNRDEATLKAALAPVEAKLAAFNKSSDKATDDQKKTDVFQEDFEKKIAPLLLEKKGIYLQFIQTHPNSLISLDALNSLGGSMPDASEVEAPFNSLSASVRATKRGRDYAAKLAELKKVVIGSMAPDFTLHDTTGAPVSLHEFKGNYLLLDFWASWCPPCRAESPYIAEAFKAYHHKGFTVLGVSLDNPDKKKEWLTAIREDHLTWTQVASLTMWDNLAAKLYSVSAIPQNFLIAPDGKIVAKNLRGTALKAKLAELLGK